MKCPSCNVALRPFSDAGQTIDVCPACQGIWLDAGELGVAAHDLIDQGVADDQGIHEAYGATPRAHDEEPVKRCPRCGEATTIFNYGYDSNVFLNRCLSCKGVWTDPGELALVAQYLKGNPAINRYADSLMDSLSGEHRAVQGPSLLYSKPLSGGIALLERG